MIELQVWNLPTTSPYRDREDSVEHIEVYATQDENRFWVECDGEGKMTIPGLPEHFVSNHYIIRFTLAQGKIKEMVEYNNPLVGLKAMGFTLPALPVPEELES